MLNEALRERLRATPFKPFVVQMIDGRRFEVPHPEFAAINRQGTEFYVVNQNDTGLTLNTLLVASIEPLQQAKS
ncbi:MAG: hypothetical protein JNL92_22015 [Opitutaceae bacterium]|nr:hypothetical protein [Opitutaceae bacterium]